MSKKRKRLLYIAGIFLVTCFFINKVFIQKKNPAPSSLRYQFQKEIASLITQKLYEYFTPGAVCARENCHETIWLFQEQIDAIVPLYHYVSATMGELEQETEETDEKPNLVVYDEITKEQLDKREGNNLTAGLNSEAENSFEDRKEGENKSLQTQEESGLLETPPASDTVFKKHEQLVKIDQNQLQDLDVLLSQFYTVDQNTTVNKQLIDVDKFLKKDFSIDKNADGPQILVFHTHSKESFQDSREGKVEDTIVGVGERLADILSDQYGYRVLHYTESFDEKSRDEAYSKALTGLEEVLEENPTIQVIIDLHRDEMKEGTKMVLDLEGRPTARFMFFNGLSRTKKTGEISYLYNKNLEDNLAFSFQMQLKAAEYYPGITRKIYLKGYRYNMHLKERFLLVELGAQNNTLEEAMNACDPLAHILDLVLDN